MSIRLRLTLLYTTILALTLIIFSVALYLIQSRATYEAIKTGLGRQAQRVRDAERRAPRRVDGALAAGTLPGRWMQTRAADGTVVGRTADLGDAMLPLSPEGLRSVQSGTPWIESAKVDDDSLLIYSLPITAQNRVVQILQVAASTDEREQALGTLGLILLAGSTLAIFGTFAGGWLLAGATLNPIHQITHTAQVIGAEKDLGRRVEHAGPNDEVGQLAVTFNTMLSELESAYRQVEETLALQRRFVADASHELRTPLTTVRGNIELLRHEPPIDPKEVADILADTRDEVDRLIRLVNQLLLLARADAKRPLRSESIPSKLLLEDTCRQAGLLAPRRTITCDVPPDIHILGDPDALKQVLLALLDNAITHTPANSTISVEAAVVDQKVIISIRDTGPGIAPHLLPHIFERFFRGDSSRSRGGAGLGLSIAKELVEAQNGNLTVESQVGSGSVFTVAVPSADV